MTRARFALGTSRAIDAMARATLADATSIYEVDAASLEAARADVIVTQDLRVLRPVSTSGARVVNLGPLRLADFYCDVKRTADAIGKHDAGLALAERLERSVQSRRR